MDEDHISRFMVIETIIVILSITFSVRATNNLIMTSIPLLAKYDFGFSQYLVGILSALASASTFLTTALINARINAKNRRISFVLSNFLYTFVLVGYWASNNVTLWMLTAAGGALLGMIMPNIITSASLFKDSALRERVLALYTVFLSLSLITGPAIESYLLNFVSLREVFLVFALFGAVATAMSPFMHFPSERRTGEKTNVIKNPGFRVALYNIMAYNIPFSILLAFAGIFEKDTFHITLSLVTLLFSMFYLSSFLSRVLLSIRPAKNVRTYMISAMGISLIGITIMETGTEFIKGKIADLASYALETAADMGFRSATPPEEEKRGGIVAIDLEKPFEMEGILRKKHRIFTSARGNSLRIAPHFYNSREDIATFFDTLAHESHKQ